MLRPAAAICLTALTIAGAAGAACSRRQPAPPPPPTTAGASLHLGFDDLPAGRAPAGFRCAWPGPADAKPARWEIVADPAAPSPGQVLAQLDGDEANHRYPVALLEGRRWGDVRVSVAAQAVSGRRDRSFGVVVRAVDERNYYVARANTSGWGSNIRFYRFVDGVRRELDEWDGEILPGRWYNLQVEAVGDVFTISLDGMPVLRVQDATFAAPGLVGVWTKAESVARFDDLAITGLSR